ncbi:iron-sulfur cluster biosynthesis transcriptional regulator SufR [Aerosakkonemataceae cyanobacterium BLCC-F154]|uniref:Iron-sulfur cluster biosynthesis transcriptional regulator SufR n=1 Tax=Floridaenema fluviatile BLCC-F154 TaxID=3153640 RepID=A0ABV4Y9I8_9CYAN
MTTTEQTSTKQDILEHLLQRGQATALELSETLDISPQAVRRHLKDLEAEELIEYELVQAGMGRPQHAYRLSRKGRDRFPNSHGKFAVSLLDTMAQTLGKEQVNNILQKQWQQKALDYRDRIGSGKLGERVAKLVDLRRAEGYMAEWYPIESETVQNGNCSQFMFTEHNCAISDVAETFPSVCSHELEMFATILPDCTVERTHWLINGQHRCGYMITKKSRS